MHALKNRPAARSAFTLVELLTVIVIIGVLAGLISAAAIPAIRAARQATIVNEIRQLEMAFGQYKEQFGDYPPDFAGVNNSSSPTDPIRTAARDAVIRHLRKAFPKYRPGVTSGSIRTDVWERFRDDVDFAPDQQLNNWPDVNLLGPDSAMVFWLGGLPSTGASTSSKLAGFSANPADPFAYGGSRLPALFEFDETRLAQDASTRFYRYVPKHVQSLGSGVAPYVYFRARSDGYAVRGSGGGVVLDDTGTPLALSYVPRHMPLQPEELDYWGVCVPYAAVATVDATGGRASVTRWFNPKTFQIICAGLDGMYSQPEIGTADYIPPVPKSGEYYLRIRYLDEQGGNLGLSEDDNLTNFATGRLEDGVQ